jgi:hypothetical protein
MLFLRILLIHLLTVLTRITEPSDSERARTVTSTLLNIFQIRMQASGKTP